MSRITAQDLLRLAQLATKMAETFLHMQLLAQKAVFSAHHLSTELKILAHRLDGFDKVRSAEDPDVPGQLNLIPPDVADDGDDEGSPNPAHHG